MELYWNDAALPQPTTRKVRSLLAYLVTHRRQPRLLRREFDVQ